MNAVPHESKTEQGTPRAISLVNDLNQVDPFNKGNSIFMSKTKRTNPANDKALGPGFYNPHDVSTFGQTKDSAFKKKIDFGS